MYALVEDGSISKLITNPKAMVIGDVRYPAKIFSVWSMSELNAIGIYEVITDSTNKRDEKWYINTNESYDFADNQVTRSWGTATPKAHADTLWTQDEINDGDAPEGTSPGDVKTRGLKYNLIQTIKQQASGLLAPTDWYVVKATEVSDYSVPSNITTYRAGVRTKVNAMETSIDGCSDVDALITLLTYTTDSEGVTSRPLGEFPDEVV